MRCQRLLPAAMLRRWPHVCHVKITFGLLMTNWFVCTKTHSTKCLVNWIPLKIRVRSTGRNTPPYRNDTNLRCGRPLARDGRSWSWACRNYVLLGRVTCVWLLSQCHSFNVLSFSVPESCYVRIRFLITTRRTHILASKTHFFCLWCCDRVWVINHFDSESKSDSLDYYLSRAQKHWMSQNE